MINGVCISSRIAGGFSSDHFGMLAKINADWGGSFKFPSQGINPWRKTVDRWITRDWLSPRFTIKILAFEEIRRLGDVSNPLFRNKPFLPCNASTPPLNHRMESEQVILQNKSFDRSRSYSSETSVPGSMEVSKYGGCQKEACVCFSRSKPIQEPPFGTREGCLNSPA